MDQVKQWATYAKDVIPRPVKNTLTAWWIGINDTGDTVSNATVSAYIQVSPKTIQLSYRPFQITDWTAFWNTEASPAIGKVMLTDEIPIDGFLFQRRSQYMVEVTPTTI